jgi:hypothetical protein
MSRRSLFVPSVPTRTDRFRARPRLEALEGRDQPALLTDFGSDVASPVPDFAPRTQTREAPPQIVDFTAEEIGNGLFVFTGQVIDAAPGGLVVTFGGGVPSVSGLTAVTNADGAFTLTVRLQTNGTDTGTVSVTTTDAQGLTSNEALVYVSPTP